MDIVDSLSAYVGCECGAGISVVGLHSIVPVKGISEPRKMLWAFNDDFVVFPGLLPLKLSRKATTAGDS